MEENSKATTEFHSVDLLLGNQWYITGTGYPDIKLLSEYGPPHSFMLLAYMVTTLTLPLFHKSTLIMHPLGRLLQSLIPFAKSETSKGFHCLFVSTLQKHMKCEVDFQISRIHVAVDQQQANIL